MAASKLTLVAVIFAIASFQLPSTAAQTRHVVGGAMGWKIPSDGAAAYTTWASGETFNVGDTLFFNFTTGFHDVTEVSEAAYGACTTANPTSRTTTGPATLTLTTPGNHYYICGVGPHCQLGQKLTVNVAGTTANPPRAGPAPAPSSASITFTRVLPVAFLALALAFF